jgi:hypothetical protein
VALVLLLGAGWWFWRAVAPGGGSAELVAPQYLQAGESARFELRVVVWGAGGPPAERYRDVRLELGPAHAPWQSQAPSALQQGPTEARFAWRVQLPKDRRIANGRVGYTVRFQFDGREQRISGELPWRPVSTGAAAS